MQSEPEVTIPVLLREARGAYALAIRKALATMGLEQLPRNTAFVLGALRSDVPFESIVRQRRGSLERAGTMDALVSAGCVRRDGDRYVLTPRGEGASIACEGARREVDEALAKAVGKRGVTALHKGLVALVEWKEANERHG